MIKLASKECISSLNFKSQANCRVVVFSRSFKAHVHVLHAKIQAFMHNAVELASKALQHRVLILLQKDYLRYLSHHTQNAFLRILFDVHGKKWRTYDQIID